MTGSLQEPDVGGDRISYLHELIESAIGPAPWYWQTFPSLRAEGRAFGWRRPTEGPNVYRVLLIEEATELPVLELRMYSCPFAANPGYLGVWYPMKESDSFEVLMFRLADLAATMDLPRGERGVAHASPIGEQVRIPNHLPGGDHAGPIARLADTVDEVLLLAGGPLGSAAAASIYVWRPASGRITVLPQEWFTADTMDLGYQWITRVARDPQTGRIVGDGIRIYRFELTDSGTQVLRFLESDPWSALRNW